MLLIGPCCGGGLEKVEISFRQNKVSQMIKQILVWVRRCNKTSAKVEPQTILFKIKKRHLISWHNIGTAPYHFKFNYFATTTIIIIIANWFYCAIVPLISVGQSVKGGGGHCLVIDCISPQPQPTPQYASNLPSTFPYLRE